MIGLDTNVLIRYITQDDEVQAPKATTLIETQLSLKAPGFITLITLVEVSWVLESCYGQSQQSILDILQGLLTTKQLLVERADMAYLALKRCIAAPGSDFSDALIATISAEQGCRQTFTFDKKARSVGMELLS
jgi:predicted nucleic-acid-binding protein